MRPLTRTRSARTSPARSRSISRATSRKSTASRLPSAGASRALTPSPRLKPVDLAAWRNWRPPSEGTVAGCRVRIGAWTSRTTRSAGSTELAERETAYGLFQRARTLLRSSPSRPGRRAARTRRAPGAGQGLDRRGAGPRLLQQRPARSRGAGTFAKLLDIDPSAPYGHFGLGQALKQLGRREEARTHLRMAVALAPDSALYRSALKRLPPA